MFFLLAALGGFCSLVGFIMFIVAGFRASVWWGLSVLFLPFVLVFGASLVGAMMGLNKETWWIWFLQVLSLVPWVALAAVHWDKAKNAFMLCVAGLVFYAAAIFSVDAETKQKMAVALQATGQPIPPVVADWLGIKKPAGPNDKPASAGGPDAPANSAATQPSTTPAAAAPSAPVASGTGPLETREQVLAAVAELNDRAAKLKSRKEMLKGSPDQLAMSQLTEDIKAFNDRLKVVTAREVELGLIEAPKPTPPPAPAIPATVVIPPSTPAPSPAPAKKK